MTLKRFMAGTVTTYTMVGQREDVTPALLAGVDTLLVEQASAVDWLTVNMSKVKNAARVRKVGLLMSKGILGDEAMFVLGLDRVRYGRAVRTARRKVMGNVPQSNRSGLA